MPSEFRHYNIIMCSVKNAYYFLDDRAIKLLVFLTIKFKGVLDDNKGYIMVKMWKMSMSN